MHLLVETGDARQASDIEPLLAAVREIGLPMWVALSTVSPPRLCSRRADRQQAHALVVELDGARPREKRSVPPPAAHARGASLWATPHLVAGWSPTSRARLRSSTPAHRQWPSWAEADGEMNEAARCTPTQSTAGARSGMSPSSPMRCSARAAAARARRRGRGGRAHRRSARPVRMDGLQAAPLPRLRSCSRGRSQRLRRGYAACSGSDSRETLEEARRSGFSTNRPVRPIKKALHKGFLLLGRRRPARLWQGLMRKSRRSASRCT